MIDTTEGIIAYLKSVSALVTETGGRIYGVRLPDGYRGEKAVLVISDGGESRVSVPLKEDSVQARCYGPTPVAGMAVQKVLHDALHRKHAVISITGGSVPMVARNTAGPRFMVEPETGWSFWVSMWELRWADRVLA